MSFSFLAPERIIFGRGTRDQLVALAMSFGTRVLLIRGRRVLWVDQLEADLAERGCQVTTLFSKGEPSVADVETAVTSGRAAQANVVVAVGGGATLDLGKAVAAMIPASRPLLDHLEGVGKGLPLEHDPLPFLAATSTAGTGAEVTKNAVITVPDAGRKVSLRDDRMMPNVAVVDPALTDGTPRAQTLASGLDALAQVIEPYLSCRSNPLTDALCRSAIGLGAQALSSLAQGEDPKARDDLAYVSLSGGLALANSGLGAVHGVAGVLGGRFGAPHGLICGRLMGPVLAANARVLGISGSDTARFDEVAQWLGQGFDLTPASVFDALPQVLDAWGVARLGGWITDQTALESIAREARGATSMKGNPCTLDIPTLVSVMRLAI